MNFFETMFGSNNLDRLSGPHGNADRIRSNVPFGPASAQKQVAFVPALHDGGVAELAHDHAIGITDQDHIT